MPSSNHPTRPAGFSAPASRADGPPAREPLKTASKTDALPAAPPANGKAPVPTWLEPFAAGINTRFTRTPDYISPPRLRGEDALPPELVAPTRAPAAPRDSLAGKGAPATPTPRPMPVARPEGPVTLSPRERLARAASATSPAMPIAEPPRAVPQPVLPSRQERRLAEERRHVEERQQAAAAAAAAVLNRKRAPIATPVTVNVSFSWPLDILAVPVTGKSTIKNTIRFEEPAPVAAPAPAARAKPPRVLAPVLPPVLPPVLAPVETFYDDEVDAIDDFDDLAAFDDDAGGYELPSLDLLSEPRVSEPSYELSAEFLDQTSLFLQQTLRDFGVRGEIIDANPGPVVTLYELEPAPGTKSSRVISLSADIARSMSAVSARVAVVEGRNVIGIELPNRERETVWLRELLASPDFAEAKAKLGLCLGKTIGGEPVIADLARMPHLLVAGTTGSGKSVAINTMILSLLYRHRPDQCRLIMIDPKMLELSVYDGIPHLLTPVVTDPKKAVTALKWAVREMEERYKKMSRLGVRNIDGFNERVSQARERGETITRVIETGFDRETGEATHEEQAMDLANLPFIVIIVDEMADLMMVAGKDIETAIQRLAQMARAAGIHIVMATQRPSVDVITGTIKANFPTRISFQVTSKIDSRTILGEMGAETLLGQGDMLYMAGGGRITRVHGPFVSDLEVEHVVAHLKRQGRPEYLDEVTSGDDDEVAPPGEDGAVFDKSAMADDGADPYDQAVAVVMRDRKASTSYIQRRLGIGYNRAASIMERMENEGIVGAANHAGKREILREGGR